MRFTSILTNLILEQSRFQVLYDKMVKPSNKGEGKKDKGLMDFETLKAIILADPTTRVPQGEDIDTLSLESMDKVKVGKFTQWILKHFVNPSKETLGISDETDPKSPEYKKARQEFERLFMEDLFKITQQLEFFEKNKQYMAQDERDINKLTPERLFNIYSNFQLPENKRKEKEKKEAKKSREGFKHAGGEILFIGDKWTLIRISDTGQTGKDAAIYYGGFQDHREGESNWCTSAPGLSYFNNYIKDGPLYVVFPNEDGGEVGKKTGLPKERYQFHFPSSQFMNRDDRQINLVEYLNGPMSELKELFKPEFARGLVSKGGNKVEISYPDSSAGKFVALYGFEELFESLPDTIDHLMITNKTNEDVAFDVPASISRFKSLKAVMFQKCIKSLPDSIGECENINYVAVNKNPDLKSLPETLCNLKKLAFINVADTSPSLNFPQCLKDKMEDEGNGFWYIND